MKVWSLAILVIAEMLAMALWFVTAALLPELAREFALVPGQQALLSSAVQIGFVAGALTFAISGLPDRFDPRRVLAVSATLAAAANCLQLMLDPGGIAAVVARFAVGFLLAGVYPVGMKIVVGWGIKDRGLLVGIVVGALTFGTAMPFVFSWMGQADWRSVVLVSSSLAAAGALLVLLAQLGPHHAQSPRFNPAAIRTALADPRIRQAYGGYLGHMWELYVMWAWIATALAVSYAVRLPQDEAVSLAKLTAFLAIAAGGLASVVAGLFADRVGKARTAIVAMAVSGAAALATAASFGGPVWLTFALVVVWGAAIVPDSAQFSALVADFSPPAEAGSIMTFQTALGFALTFLTVQAAPMLAAAVGWPIVLAALAIGPALGILSMRPLARLEHQSRRRPH